MFRYTNPDEIMQAIKEGQASSISQKASADQPIVARRRPKARPETLDPVQSNQEMIMEYLSMIGEPVEVTSEVTEAAPETSLRPKGRYEVPQGDVQSYVYEGLLKRGMSENVAKGFMMNFQDESAFNVDIEEKEPNVHGTKGKGLYQLTGIRRDQFEEQYGNDYSIDNQLDFLVNELQTTEKSAFDKMLQTDTAREAAVAIVKSFLRPAKKHEQNRVKKYLNSVGYTPRGS